MLHNIDFEDFKIKRKAACDRCERCGRFFAEGEIKYLKKVDHRIDKLFDNSSYLCCCMKCNYIMYLAEKELQQNTDLLISEFKKAILILVEDTVKKNAGNEALAILEYSLGEKFAARPIGDKLFCGIQREKTNGDLKMIIELASWLGISKPNSQQIAAHDRNLAERAAAFLKKIDENKDENASSSIYGQACDFDIELDIP